MMAEEVIISDPEILWGMPVIKGTRVPVYDLAASVKAGIPRDRILAAYPTIQEHHLDLAVAYAEANPLAKMPSSAKGRPNCLVAERCWDRVRWAIEEYTWRFDGSRRPPRAWWRI